MDMGRGVELDGVVTLGEPRLLLRNRVKRLKMLVAVVVVSGKVDYWHNSLIARWLRLCPDLGNWVEREVRSGRQVWNSAGRTGLSRFSTEACTEGARSLVGCVGSLGNCFGFNKLKGTVFQQIVGFREDNWVEIVFGGKTRRLVLEG